MPEATLGAIYLAKPFIVSGIVSAERSNCFSPCPRFAQRSVPDCAPEPFRIRLRVELFDCDPLPSQLVLGSKGQGAFYISNPSAH